MAMRYQIEPEIAPGSRLSLAVSPVTPMLVGLTFGGLPGLAWLIANASFLGCRDAHKQIAVGSAGLAALLIFGAVAAGAMEHVDGFQRGDLAFELTRNFYSLCQAILGFWLLFRQHPTEDYLRQVAGFPRYAIVVGIGACVVGVFLKSELSEVSPILRHALFGI